MWAAIHICMEATLGISLYSYLYLKLAKTLSFILSLTFLFNKMGELLPGSGRRGKRGSRWPKQCIYM
jgi:hypothetical protein